MWIVIQYPTSFKGLYFFNLLMIFTPFLTYLHISLGFYPFQLTPHKRKDILSTVITFSILALQQGRNHPQIRSKGRKTIEKEGKIERERERERERGERLSKDSVEKNILAFCEEKKTIQMTHKASLLKHYQSSITHQTLLSVSITPKSMAYRDAYLKIGFNKKKLYYSYNPTDPNFLDCTILGFILH